MTRVAPMISKIEKRPFVIACLAALLAAGSICAGMVVSTVAQQAPQDPEDRQRWNRKYDRPEYVYGTRPSRFLAEQIHLLPTAGRALDLAAGEGRNAVFLARRGLTVDAIDISAVGLAKAQKLAEDHGVEIRTIAADLEHFNLPRETYDVVVVFNYLQRDLFDDIEASLKPGGVLLYETYTVAHLEIPGAHSMPRRYCLEAGELRSAFPGLEVLEYRETVDEERAVGSLVAARPAASTPETGIPPGG
jgi:tellurite methyltransferase